MIWDNLKKFKSKVESGVLMNNFDYNRIKKGNMNRTEILNSLNKSNDSSELKRKEVKQNVQKKFHIKIMHIQETANIHFYYNNDN